MPIRNPDEPGDYLPDEPGGIATTPTGDDAFTFQLRALYQQYYGRDPTPGEIDASRANPGGLAAIETALRTSVAPTQTTEAPSEPPTTTTTPPPTTATAPSPYTGGTAFDPYPGGQFVPPSTTLPGVPVYQAPVFEAPPMFQAPTLEQAMATPGYQFRLGEGKRALENSAAAKGLVRTGGTLKDLLAYGQNYATNAYRDTFDQALTTYKTNYGVNSDVYDRMADAAKLNYTGQLAGYQNQVRGNELDYSRAWDRYLTNYNQWKRDQEWKYGVLHDQQTMGLNSALA
jgi:hypothetical protein